MKARHLIVLSTFAFSTLAFADQYQEQTCSNVSKSLQAGDIIPKNCTEIFKVQSDFFKQVDSEGQNLGVWVKNNLIYIYLEKHDGVKVKTEEKLIGGKELSVGKVIDFDISPSPLFDNTFEIHLLIEEDDKLHIVTYLSSQRNGQKPRVATFSNKQEFNALFRGKDQRLWLIDKTNKVYNLNSAADSFSKNESDHPIIRNFSQVPISDISYITSNKNQTLILSKNKVIVFEKSGTKTYSVSGLKSLSKYEINNAIIQNNKLFINTGDNELLQYSIQTAVK